ncbi:hypothetical protein PT2222_50047 [Paraburkholderia tropica]
MQAARIVDEKTAGAFAGSRPFSVRRAQRGLSSGLRAFLLPFDVGQEHRENADQRQERADLVDERDAGGIRELAEHGRADAAETEREAEEQARDHAHLARNQFLRVDEDRRERRGQHDADDHREHAGPEQVRVGQQQRERRDAQDRTPDHVLAADAVADRAADDRARGHGGEEHEQVHLRGLHGQMEAVDQIEREVAVDAREVEVLREHQQHEDADGHRHASTRERDGRRFGALLLEIRMRLVPAADLREHEHRHQRGHREPRDAALTMRNDDRGGQQRSERRARVAADLEQRLREAVAAARGHARNPRRLRMEHRRAAANQRGGDQQHAEARRDRHQQQAAEREAHADGQRIRHRALVRIDADERLQHRRRDLVRERDQADLRERQREVVLEHRIDGQDQRLDHVVEQVRKTDRTEHAVDRALHGRRGGRCGGGRCGRSGGAGQGALVEAGFHMSLAGEHQADAG